MDGFHIPQPAHVFSTDFGRKPPRPATDPSTHPIPACVIARSNQSHDVHQYAGVLQSRYPRECEEIYAGFNRSDFFDPYDIHLHSAEFLDAVLRVLAEPNNLRVRNYALSFATENPQGVIKLSKLQINSEADLASTIANLFPPAHVNMHGVRMFGHVVCQLKCSMMASSEPRPLPADRMSMENPVTSGQGPINHNDSMPFLKHAKRTDSSKEPNKGNSRLPRSSSAAQDGLHPPSIVPNNSTYANDKCSDMRRTMSAEHYVDLNNGTSRMNNEQISSKAGPRNLNGNWSHLNVNQGAVSLPQTPMLSASTSSNLNTTRQSGNHESPSVVPSIPLPSAYKESFGQIHQANAGSRHSSAQSTRSPYISNIPAASQAPMRSIHGQTPAFFPMTSQDMTGAMTPRFFVSGQPPFQQQLPLGNSMPMNYSTIEQSRFTQAQGTWDNIDQPILSPPPVHSEYNHELTARCNQGDVRGSFAGKGNNIRGPSTTGPYIGRGGSYMKPNGNRKVSVGSANYRGRRNTQGSNGYLDSYENGNHGDGMMGDRDSAHRGTEPFPNFSGPLDQLDASAMANAPEQIVTQSFIGAAREDVVDLWVTGFNMRRDDDETSGMLVRLFETKAKVRSVTIMHRPDSLHPFAFINFYTSAGARAGLGLNGDLSTGSQPLRVQVSEKYCIGSRRWSKPTPYGQRRTSDAHGQYHHRGANESRGSFGGGSQPVYMSPEYAQSLGYTSPQGPPNPNFKRSNQWQQQFHGLNARRYPSGANAEFIQRLDTNHANENAPKGSHVQYSPQDCRSSMPVRERNFETNSSPERKKKGSKSRSSPIKTGSESSSSTAQVHKSNMAEKDVAAGDETNVREQGPFHAVVEAEPDNIEGALTLHTITSRECEPIPESLELDGPPKAEVLDSTKELVACVERSSTSSPATILIATSETSSEQGGSTHDQSVTTPESRHRIDDSFHSAMEAQTPRFMSEDSKESIVEPSVTRNTSTNAVDTGDIETESKAVPGIVALIEDPVSIDKSSSSNEPALDEDSVFTEGPADSPVLEDTGHKVFYSVEDQKAGKVETREDHSRGVVTPPLQDIGATSLVQSKLEPDRAQNEGAIRSGSSSTNKPKSPKPSTQQQQHQAALHPFAKANQAKKSKAQKKKEKRQQKVKDVAKVNGHASDKQLLTRPSTPTPSAPTDPVVELTCEGHDIAMLTETASDANSLEVEKEQGERRNSVQKTRSQASAVIEIDVPTAFRSGSMMLDAAVKPEVDELKAKKDGNASTMIKTEKGNPNEKEEKKKKAVKPPPSPEKKPKSTLAQKAAKLVAMPDLSMLRRKDASSAAKK
ncbi:hypothetical protein EJ05DRAFT_490160 [Pseudovirgaria hyperparasitica]|uniref:RRM domain-containing protein n=1 Tax=Pseudovirgaria hyperparasitica TaxID=470096 RepID=A0A6A6VS11_9PEZI|nr:uncharacterized protein EJ05DRAFT_490160 [Pseudovirgaria hyperparasitica]KAF2753468.1 hypothetical protein EJ05DRAFT_490160 [Pseudovirgaria hyperparasitica]